MNDLRLVELELWSYCNRKCIWCPNSFIDRKFNTNYIDANIFKNLIQSLKDMNYSGYITFSRYNEPLAYVNALNDACKYIKQELPNCTLITNTNGDFLSSDIIHNLQIDELSIMDYDNKGMQFCVDKLNSWHCEIDEIVNNFIYAHYENMKILYYVDWKNNYTPGNRGGSLPIEEPIRNYPCTEPLYFIGVNYDGTISPCCNIRNDIGSHKSFILGDLHEQNLEEIINSSKRAGIINYCKKAKFEPNSPCYKCSNKGGRYTREKGGIKYE